MTRNIGDRLFNLETKDVFMQEMAARLLLRTFMAMAFAASTHLLAQAQGQPKVTVLYDNTGHRPDCSTDWGFACIIKGMEKTILFDTGTKGEVLLENAKSLGVDLSETGVVVISHVHQDHAGGLMAVLPKMPGVPVWLPHSSPQAVRDRIRQAGGSVFSSGTPQTICRDAMLTGELGEQILEQALVLRTPHGLVVITGCAHPGIVPILERAHEIGSERIFAAIGGFHLLQDSDAVVAEILGRFRQLKVAKVGATHCTGAKQIEQFRQAYGADFIEMGAGRVLTFE